MLVGQGIEAGGYHPAADLLPDEETLKRLAHIRDVVARTRPSRCRRRTSSSQRNGSASDVEPETGVLTELARAAADPRISAASTARRFHEEIRAARPAGGDARARRATGRRCGRARSRDRGDRRLSHALPAERPGRRRSVGRAGDRGPLLLQRRHHGLNFSRGTSAARALPRASCCATADEPQPHAMAVQSEPIPEMLPGFARRTRSPLLARASSRAPGSAIAIRVAPHYDLMENIGVRRRRPAALHRVPARAARQPLSRPVRADAGRHAGQHGRPARARPRPLSRALPRRRRRAQSAHARAGRRDLLPSTGGTGSIRSSRSTSSSTTGGTRRGPSAAVPMTR